MTNEERIDIYTRLLLPFEPWEHTQREIHGEVFDAVPAEAIANRYDDVLGPGNWSAQYKVISDVAVECTITIILPDGTTDTKTDCGGVNQCPDLGDRQKTGYSDAFKRAARWHGPGRYLWKMGIPKFARAAFWQEQARICAAFGVPYDGPEAYAPHRQPADKQPTRPEPTAVAQKAAQAVDHPAIASGSKLYGWLKDRGLLNEVSRWGSNQGFRSRCTEWTVGQRALAVEHAERLLKTRAKQYA